MWLYFGGILYELRKEVKEHPVLFEYLKEHVPDLIENPETPSPSDISLYQIWVGYYCGKFFDNDLMNKLI